MNPVRKVAPPDGSTGNPGPMTEGSGPFPIQTVLFEIFKYQTNSNPYNPDSTPPIRSIALYPQDSTSNTCFGVAAAKCVNPTSGIVSSKSCCRCCNWSDPNHPYKGDPDCITCTGTLTTRNTEGCSDTCKNFKTEADCDAGIRKISFCAPWDGMYEVDGEFAKTNGQYGFRTAISSQWPGDGVSTPDIDISHTIVYPGNQQVPIKVDVTNVHSVRSSPTLVGARVQMPAQPYKILYRISKDALVRVQILDQANPEVVHRNLIKWEPRLGEGTPMNPGDVITTEVEGWDGRDNNGRFLPYGNYTISVQALSQDIWNNTDSLKPWTTTWPPLCPANTTGCDEGEPYITYSSGGTMNRSSSDLSRAVTRQLSLDPLKITDITDTGLGKTSTAYAMLSYTLTEDATVYVRIYSPGTRFDNTIIAGTAALMKTAATNNVPNPIVPAIAANSGYLLASYNETKAGRVSVNTKWDGRCWNAGAGAVGTGTGCAGFGYTAGAALPDGDYVYLIWAEIPYAGTQTSAAGSACQATETATISINGHCWNGVKTRMLHNGILPIARGYPDITVQPVGYSTIGSSPTAFGLDPFIFRYSLSRDSVVDVNIKTSSASPTATATQYTVKRLLVNTAQVASQMNVQTWDGKDDNGRYVSPGTYMLEVVAKDALFPTKQTTATVLFPLDLFRTVDVSTTPLIGDASGQAKIRYMLSKSMHVDLNIFDTDVLIPAPGQSSKTNGNPNAPCPVICPAGTTAANLPNCIHRIGVATPLAANNVVSPIRTFEGTRPGDGVLIEESWDGYWRTGPTNDLAILNDGLYPYLICARSEEAGANYYQINALGVPEPINGAIAGTGGTAPLPNWLNANPAVAASFMYSTDKPTGYVTIARGPVYFSSIVIKPSIPQLFFSSETVQLPPYEVAFAVTRTANVRIDIINQTGGCMGSPAPGTLCRTLTQQSATLFTTTYDPVVVHKLYWDGKDNDGIYVKKGSYEFRFTAIPYMGLTTPPPSMTEIRSEQVPVNNFQVFDRFIWDVSQQNKGQGKFAYQLSVPMKTAIQIFKPGTRINGFGTGSLCAPEDNCAIPVTENSLGRVLVKAIIGVRPHLVAIEDIWDGTDLAGQKVPDGVYPYRFTTVLDSYFMDSIDGHAIPPPPLTLQDIVADWDKFVNLGEINVVNGDSFFADIDWKSDKVTMFFPNPLRQSFGQFEMTKIPAPGTVSIKIYNIAGDLVRDGGYQCINARGDQRPLEVWNAQPGGISPDIGHSTGTSEIVGGRNFTLRCTWDKTNNHGRQVARGLYYAIMELNPTRGNAKKSQKVIKILIP